MSDHKIFASPTDMLHRRTPLLPYQRFRWLGSAVMIGTNSPALLSAVNAAGFRPDGEAEQGTSMQWEIVSEEAGLVSTGLWTCKVTVTNHSLFLSMGPGQWFAFDFQTGDGAGFFSQARRAASNLHEMRYLSAITRNVGACLRDTHGWSSSS